MLISIEGVSKNLMLFTCNREISEMVLKNTHNSSMMLNIGETSPDASPMGFM